MAERIGYQAVYLSGGALSASTALPDIGPAGADLQASQFDHIRDLRKHERA